ncbi:hypothetical protein XENOCAPTIV_030322, partial [Xenoophorus captivus]
VRLRCTEGSVRWVYPGQALRVALEPNLSSIRYNTVCIQEFPSLSGASVFIERAGELELLVTEDGGRTGRQVFCFQAGEPHTPVIYLQAGPQSPETWSRRIVGFRYKLLRNRSANSGLERAAFLQVNHGAPVCDLGSVMNGDRMQVREALGRIDNLLSITVRHNG